jgi:GT2 family glycosyltransferase
MIAIVVVTLNRLPLLRKSVENVLNRTESTTEIVIWNNASSDETASYLATLSDPRIVVVNSPDNVGLNGYARAFRLTTAPYMVELDDDVVDAPQGWDSMLLDAYRRLPEIGFLAADLVDEPNDPVSRFRHYVRPEDYRPYESNGVRLLEGPTGGGCAMTDRELSDRVGGFSEHPERFFQEESEYIGKIAEVGYRAAILADLRVHHTGGPGFTYQSPEKMEWWSQWYRRTKTATEAGATSLAARAPVQHSLPNIPTAGSRPQARKNDAATPSRIGNKLRGVGLSLPSQSVY